MGCSACWDGWAGFFVCFDKRLHAVFAVHLSAVFGVMPARRSLRSASARTLRRAHVKHRLTAADKARAALTAALRPLALQPLPVYVCEDHNEVLRAIYTALRVGRLPFTSIALLHFDSHPDLACPEEIPPDMIQSDPEEVLHKLRNASGGIAEWIIPAVFAGHINRVAWIRPPWSKQIRDGEHHFHVGEATGRVCVSCDSPYWRFNVPASKMVHAQPLELVVSLAHPGGVAAVVQDRSWILDVCLDYFTTRNPFVDSLRAAKLDAGALECVYSFYTFALDAMDCSVDLSKLVHAILAGRVDEMTVKARSRHPTLRALMACFPEKCRGTLRVRLDAMLESAIRWNDETRAAVAECGPCLELPHHPSTRLEMAALLREFASCLKGLTPPKLVTIACSTEDGFTPAIDVPWLLRRVLRTVQTCYGVTTQIVFDESLNLSL